MTTGPKHAGFAAANRKSNTRSVVLQFGLEKRSTMKVTTTSDMAERVIATLRTHEAALRHAGIRRLSLFGSVARGDAEADSDVDLLAELDPAAKLDLVRLVTLERQLGELLGRPVDLLPEPVEKQHLRANIERDCVRAF